jgi:nucleotide-binding universal stress UspA family protein
MFARASILLVAVGEPAPRYPRAVLSQGEWRSAFRDTIAAAGDRACDVAEQALGRLTDGDREIDVEIRFGDVGAELVAAARVWPADLVVVGAHSRPLLQRLFLGSVARTVLDGVDASVLVARPPAADGSAAR